MFTSNSIIMKKATFRALSLATAFVLMAPSALAARYSLTDNNSLIQGCSGTIEIKVDTQGANVMAGDTTLATNPAQSTINQLTIGTPLPMQVFNQVENGTLKLSGARLPMSGTFNGVGTFGYINFTPALTTNSVSFNFSQDLNIDNNLVDENINNVLTEAVSKTYNVRDRYNKDIDGVGFCTPDTTAPTVQFIAPMSGSGNNPVDTNIVFTITDDRAGVNISSLDFTIGGTAYNQNSPEVTVQQEQGLYRVETDPAADFAEGANVQVRVTICDSNNPANCATRTASFRIYEPAPPLPVCGDGVVNYQNGEQCDDGNTQSGDGCSALCLYEIPVGADPSCSDGLQNGGEAGIDCGGPCPTPCATCIDGLQNQGEESVDCGGPCPPCGYTGGTCPVCEDCGEEEGGRILVCHYPANDPENPITIEINENAWPAHEAQGDTLGACAVFDLCSEALFQAAPEIEEKAVEEAEAIIEEGVVEVQEVRVEVVLDQLDLCRQNPEFSGADFDSVSADTDEDGLSDRMECYAGSNPVKSDTDGDGCDDFRELNQDYTNPTDNTDCFVEAETERFSNVLITDPQPGWILTTNQPGISGKVPADTILVLVVATQSEQALTNALLKSLESAMLLSGTSPTDDVQAVADKLQENIKKAEDFLENYGTDFDSEAFENVIASFKTLTTLDLTANRSKLEDLKAELAAMRSKPVVVAASTDLADTTVGELSAKNFEGQSNPLTDKQLYDLVATAYLNDGSQISSKAVRFSVDKSTFVSPPVPKTLGGKLIAAIPPFHNIFIGKAFAQDSDEKDMLVIDQTRPVVTGETEFGSQVFAIWNSVVLSSSVISDSEIGAFEVQAPRNLEVDSPHRVTLYAVKTEGGNKIRSESVDVHFKIKTEGVGVLPIAVAGGGVALLFLLVFLIRRLQRRSVLKVLTMSKLKSIPKQK